MTTPDPRDQGPPGAAPAEAAPSVERLERLADAIERRLAAERGAWSTLAALPSRWRAVVALAAVWVPAAVMVVVAPRPDLGTRAPGEMLASVSALGLVAVLAVVPVLGRDHRPPRRLAAPTLRVTSLLAAVVVPVLLAWWTGAGPTGSDVGARWIERSAACAAIGTTIGLGFVLVGLGLDRARGFTDARVMLVAAAAGLAGDLALQLHCPWNDRPHLLVGHAGVVLAFVVVAWAANAMARSRARQWPPNRAEVE